MKFNFSNLHNFNKSNKTPTTFNHNVNANNNL